jgi:hypothetical protein
MNGGVCGNSTARPCVCTGPWTGQNCTDFIGQIPISRPDISEHVERCNASYSTALSPFSYNAPSADIPCPSICTHCFNDDSGVPVCWISLPIPNLFYGIVDCPATHRCVAVCEPGMICPTFLNCFGNEHACEAVTLTGSTDISITCNSSTLCRQQCVSPGTEVVGLKSRFQCIYPNGSCLCESDNCGPNIKNCTQGVNCNGDPCSATVCAADKFVELTANGTCNCVCVPTQYDTEGRLGCVYLNISKNCQQPCQNGGLCRDAKCYCPPGYSGADCSIRDSCVALNITATCTSECDYCRAGVCFLLIAYRIEANIRCPVGWPCVFICDEQCSNSRYDAASTTVVCPSGSGPCTFWCWGYSALRCILRAVPDLTYFLS